jgi:hypothetical protein
MAKLFENIWKGERVPAEWLKGNICKLPKKGNLSLCNNWRGVTLLNVAAKAFTRFIFKRIQDPIEEILRENQAGFRKIRECIDMVFVLRRFIENTAEYKRQFFVNFVDFEKAFNNVFREALWSILKEYGLPDKIMTMIKALYVGFECAVIHDGNLSAYFQVESGVKQWCLLLGLLFLLAIKLLFLLAIDWLMKKVTERQEMGIEWVEGGVLENPDYEDDLCLVSDNFDDVQER